jgi:hypothetical protein
MLQERRAGTLMPTRRLFVKDAPGGHVQMLAPQGQILGRCTLQADGVEFARFLLAGSLFAESKRLGKLLGRPHTCVPF